MSRNNLQEGMNSGNLNTCQRPSPQQKKLSSNNTQQRNTKFRCQNNTRKKKKDL